MSIPSLKRIKELTHYARAVDPDDAARDIREALERATGTKSVDAAIELTNQLIGGHGVEAINGDDAYVDSYYHDIVALYVNMGDTYNLTLLGKFYVTTWGDWVETQERSRRYRFR